MKYTWPDCLISFLFAIIMMLVLIGIFSIPVEVKAMDTLQCLNAQRAQFGLYPLRPDPQLQAKAEWAARQRSFRHLNGHLQRGPVAGRWEGTAKRNSRRRGSAGELWGPEDVYACYQNHRRATYAGCASYLGADGYWYYQLNLR